MREALRCTVLTEDDRGNFEDVRAALLLSEPDSLEKVLANLDIMK